MQVIINKKTKSMQNKNLSYVISLIAIFIAMHYFFSFDVLWYYLGKFKLDTLSILSWEDVQFSIAPLNSTIFLLLGIMLGGYVIAISFIPKDTNPFDKQGHWLEKQMRKRSKRTKIISLVILVIIFLFLILSTYFYNDSKWIYTGLIFMIALLAYLRFNTLDIIVICVIFLITAGVYGDFKAKHETLYSSDIKIEMTDGRIITSDINHKLVFFGTKYIIIQSDSTNTKLYPTSDIKEIEWIN